MTLFSKTRSISLALLLFVNFFYYCQSGTKLANEDLLKKNLTVLASDEFEGREIASKGGKMAADYIAKNLQKYGIQPFGDNGSYFQNFPVYVSGFDISSSLSFSTDSLNKTINLKQNEDYIVYDPAYLPFEFNIAGTELIYVGYGITADEYNYDDYQNVDAEGKIVVVMDGEPASSSKDYFEGDYTTEHSELENKLLLAKEHGAVAMITLPDEQSMSTYGYKKKRAERKDFSLDDYNDDSKKETELIPSFLFSTGGANKLFGFLHVNFFAFRSFINSYKHSSDLPMNIKMNSNYKITEVREARNAMNVIGLLPGTDPDLAHEYVTLGAHYDHEGIQNGIVFNGADDNASGTVAVLEAARLFAESKSNKRPILFIFHTGEERGLLGSKYLTEHSNFVDDIMVHINVDMVGRGNVNEIFSIGSDRISLDFHQLIEKVNDESVNIRLDYSFDSDNDPNRYYYRSDHYNYAKKGIPIVFFYDHMTEDYHRPTDDVEKIKFAKVAKMTNLIYLVGLETANLEEVLD